MMKGAQGNCWRRKSVDVTKCSTGTKFDTWVMTSVAPPSPPPPPTPPMPSSEFPTTVPAFMKAFVEGLLSDSGADAHKCEGVAADFASAMETLGHTAVAATKAVAAAVEGAKEKCVPVAKDALKLAVSMLQDAFHPQRLAEHFQATRTDVLAEIGFALEALAKKDFKSSGNNAGKFTRRLIEGPQESQDASFLNSKAQTPETANTVASIAGYVVTYWAAAAMTQDSLASESPEEWGDFLEGLLEGLMSDGSDFSDCMATIPVVKQAVKTAKKGIGRQLAATAVAAKAAKRSCGILAGDAERLAKAAFYDLKHPDQVAQNFHDAQYGLLMDLGHGFVALAKNDYAQAGDLMGMAVRRLIEGRPTSTVVV